MEEHLRLQHRGKQVPTKVCPLCNANVQKIRNHFIYTHKFNQIEAENLYRGHFGRRTYNKKRKIAETC